PALPEALRRGLKIGRPPRFVGRLPFGGAAPMLRRDATLRGARYALSPHNGPHRRHRSIARFLLQQARPQGSASLRERAGPRHANMAFIRASDGSSIELLQKGPAKAKAEPWASMPNTGSW